MRKILIIFLPIIFAALLFGILIFLLSSNKGKGALQVTSSPSSKVYLNGVSIGQTPLCKCELKEMIKEGEYVIKLVPVEGDALPFEQKIKITPKVLTVVDRKFGEKGIEEGSIISLIPISNKKDAQISVISFPGQSQIFLDNNLSGQSPVLVKDITESDHELKVSKEGYKDKIIRIRTALGYRLEAIVFLGINPSIASQSSTFISSQSSNLAVQKVVILETPTGFLRVRSTASIASDEITRVEPGEVFELLSEKSGWFEIKLKDGKSGWISSQYAKKN